jgi:hypothetical protein
VFQALTDQRINSKEFTKKLDRNNLKRIRKREIDAGRAANPVRGIEIRWKVELETQQEIIATHFSEKDKALVA